jgi:MFS family permease
MVIGFLLILPFVGLSILGERVPGARVSVGEYWGDLLKPGVLVFAAVVMLFGFHFGVEAACFTLLLQDTFQLGQTQVGLVYLYISVVLSGVMLTTGLLSDRAHRPLLIGFVAIVCSGVGNLLMPWIGSVGWLLAVRFVHVVGDGAFMVFQSFTVANLFHRRRLGGNVGLFIMVSNLGSFFGAAASGYIPGYDWPFFVSGILAAGGLSVYLVLGKAIWSSGVNVESEATVTAGAAVAAEQEEAAAGSGGSS